MKLSKTVLPILLIGALCLSWFSFFARTIRTQANYNQCMDDAKSSIEAGLYEQGIEFYKESLKYKASEKTYVKIKETYDLLYAEEHTSFIRGLYLDDMALASTAYPKKALFWEVQVSLYLDAENYSKAYETAKKAGNHGAKSDTLSKQHFKLSYMTRLNHQLYPEFKTALNGYISVFDGKRWSVIDEAGEELTGHYAFIGPLNADGKGMYVNDISARILDKQEIARARFDGLTIEDAGIYNEDVDLIPVKINGKWKYMNSKGAFVGGEYEVAGSFYEKSAVAYTGSQWVSLNEKGNETALSGFEDIVLDLNNCHVQGDVIIAKKDGKYHFYDKNFKQRGDFSADQMDKCLNGEAVAFQSNGKWGFVDVKGKVVIEPKYLAAKSFSNGYAAVCNDQNQWGFINSSYEMCIDYQFIDAFYFSAKETCMVSVTENTVQLLSFMFE